MKRKPLDGKNLMLWLGNKVVALSKSCSLNIDITLGDGNTKDDGLWDSGDIVGASWTQLSDTSHISRCLKTSM